MAIRWRLKTYLAAKHGIFTAVKFQQLIIKKTGIVISHSNLCKYLRKAPVKIPLETLEIFCSALNCSLSTFCEVEPKEKKPSDKIVKYSYKNTPHTKKGQKSFPDPTDYYERKKT